MQQRLDARGAVPVGETTEEVPDRVVAVLTHDGLKGIDEGSLDHLAAAVGLGEPAGERGVVRVVEAVNGCRTTLRRGIDPMRAPW